MKPMYGSYSIQADERGRMRIPSTYRAAFGDTKLYGFKNKKGCYIRIFGADVLEKLVDGFVGTLPLEECKRSAIIRRINSHIIDIEEDKQGRFTVPQTWREKIQFKKEAVFVGMGNSIELWAKEVYDAYELADEENDDDIDIEMDDFLANHMI
ncbi:MAG: hypothetical protein K2G37_05975 [Clostridia bacterium]|nr:hypothetical protein [Clostridia bacterium]MDE7328327.1 hypothetical protein [Clostridia bacterium]